MAALDGRYTEPYASGYNGEEAEYIEMVTSVLKTEDLAQEDTKEEQKPKEKQQQPKQPTLLSKSKCISIQLHTMGQSK